MIVELGGKLDGTDAHGWSCLMWASRLGRSVLAPMPSVSTGLRICAATL
jgi:hypothetical protein